MDKLTLNGLGLKPYHIKIRLSIDLKHPFTFTNNFYDQVALWSRGCYEVGLTPGCINPEYLLKMLRANGALECSEIERIISPNFLKVSGC